MAKEKMKDTNLAGVSGGGNLILTDNAVGTDGTRSFEVKCSAEDPIDPLEECAFIRKCAEDNRIPVDFALNEYLRQRIQGNTRIEVWYPKKPSILS
jgi:hypothetical protein